MFIPINVSLRIMGFTLI